MTPKSPPLRDRAWLDHLRTERCIVTGLSPSEFDAVDPAHIGTLGKGIKSPDNHALPIRHSIHAEMHQRGEMTVLRERVSDDVLRAAFRALAEQRYREHRGLL